MGVARFRLRVVVAVAACMAAVAALSIVLALRASNGTHEPAAAAPLIGVTWQGAGSVVFTEHTVRIFDGCLSQLREVTIGAGLLDMGSQVGPGSICSRSPGGPPPEVAAFEAILFSDHLAWQRTGDTLRLTDASGQSVELRAQGPALQLTGQAWVLERYDDPRYYTHEGNFRAARLLISDDGSVRATDMCNDLAGSATVTDSTIAFTDMRSTERACTGQVPAAVAVVVDQVLSGTASYTIRGNELIIFGKQPGQLIYTPGR